MSLAHKNVHQVYGEFICTHCGKSWAADDRDPPACTEEAAEIKTGLRYQGSSHGSSGPFKGAPENLPRTLIDRDLSELERRVVAEAGEYAQLDGDVYREIFRQIESTGPLTASELRLSNVLSRARAQRQSEVMFAPYGLPPIMGAYLIASPHASLPLILGYAPNEALLLSLVSAAFRGFSEASSFTVTRHPRMDKYARGQTSYFELNPRLIEEARRVPGFPACEHTVKSVSELYRALAITNRGKRK